MHLPYNADPVIMEKGNLSATKEQANDSDEAILGKEGAHIWKTHFSSTPDSKEVIQVPIEWVNFLSVALLYKDKFDWAKKFISSQVWNYIIQGSESQHCKPFAVPDKCVNSFPELCSTKSDQSQEVD